MAGDKSNKKPRPSPTKPKQKSKPQVQKSNNHLSFIQAVKRRLTHEKIHRSKDEASKDKKDGSKLQKPQIRGSEVSTASIISVNSPNRKKLVTPVGSFKSEASIISTTGQKKGSPTLKAKLSPGKKQPETVKGKNKVSNIKEPPKKIKKNAKGTMDLYYLKKLHVASSQSSMTSMKSGRTDSGPQLKQDPDPVEILMQKTYKIPPCPKTLTKSNETRLVKGFLDLKKPYVIPRYGKDVKRCPKGLEFLHSVEYLHLDLRRVYSPQGTCYVTYSQFDMKNERQGDRLMSFGIETTTKLQVFCCQESRAFQLHFYDYNATRIFKAVHGPSLVSCLTRYLFCCVCGSNACGHKMTVYDNTNNSIGYIKQRGCCAKRFTMFMEKELHFNGNKIRSSYTTHEFFSDHRYEEAELLKLDVFNSNNECFVRIEQHLPNSFLCKFIYMNTMEPVGYVRRGGSTILQLDLWRDFHETEKALLIAGAVLVDHLIIGISIEGTYVDPEMIAGITDSDKTVPVQRTKLYRIFCFNRLRTILIVIFLVLVALIIAFVVLVVLEVVEV